MRPVAFILSLSLLVRVAHSAPMDEEDATAALGRVVYRSCGRGGAGVVKVTFAADGHASADVSDGAYSLRTIQCLERRFAAVRVAPFDGAPRTVAYAIALAPDPPATPAIRYVYVDFKPDEWRHGAAVPPGFRVEHSLRLGPLWAAIPLSGLGSLFIIGDVLNADRINPETGRAQGTGLVTLIGATFVVAGSICALFGFAGKDRLVKDPSATTWSSRVRPAIGPMGGGVTLLF